MNRIRRSFLLSALVLAGGTCLGVTTVGELYEFTKVNTLSEDPAGGGVAFVTDAGKRVRIRNQGAGTPGIDIVRWAAHRKTFVFIAYDSADGVCRFAVPFNEDYVKSVELSRVTPQALEVVLLRRPSPLSLPFSHPRFQELRRVLDAAKGVDQLVWVGTFPGDGEILDVRVAER